MATNETQPPLFPEEVGPNDEFESRHAEKSVRYGLFETEAKTAQALRNALSENPNWPTLPPVCQEAVLAIAMKLARIVNGDEFYEGSWVSLIGYAKLALTYVEFHNDAEPF